MRALHIKTYAVWPNWSSRKINYYNYVYQKEENIEDGWSWSLQCKNVRIKDFKI